MQSLFSTGRHRGLWVAWAKGGRRLPGPHLKGRPRGFGISVDALFATIVTVSVIAVLLSGIEGESPLKQDFFMEKQAADDAFGILDSSGFLSERLSNSELSQLTLKGEIPGEPGIWDYAKRLLPLGLSLKVIATEYRPRDIGACQAGYGEYLAGGKTLDEVFETCFGEEPYASEQYPDVELPDKPVSHGRIISVASQPAKETHETSRCILESSWKLAEKESDTGQRALFEDGLETDIETFVQVTDGSGAELNDGNPLLCYSTGGQENETAKVTLKVKSVTRDPIAIMLAMDESASMATYDIERQEKTGSFDAGTCNGEACHGTTGNCPTQNSEYTNWQLIGGFTADAAFLTRFVGTIDQRFDNFFNPTRNDPGTCSIIPRMRIVAPDGTIFYAYYSTTATPSYYSYIRKSDIEAHNTGGNVWNIYGWSNVAVTSNVYRRFWGYLPAENVPGTFSGGAAEGTGVECVPDQETFKKIGTLTLPALKAGQYFQYIYAYILYNGSTYESESGCLPRLYFKKEDGSDQSAETKCTNLASSAYCSASKGYSQSSQPSGNYEIWAWSDDEVSLTDARFAFYITDDVLGGYKAISDVTVDCSANGCGNEACVISEETNCGTKTGWVDGVSGGPGDLDRFTIGNEDHLIGLRAVAGSSGYAGACTYPAFGIRAPDGSIFKTWSGPATTTISGSPSSPLGPGSWEFEGWADEETDFSVNWHLQRIDASKRAAKIFIENAQWKSNDEIGTLGFSDATRTLHEMANVEAYKEEIKDSLNGLAPQAQTGVADAISSSASALLAGAPVNAGKFIVLLTDGEANICLGGAACSKTRAKADAEAMADAARAQGITIYVIGFAERVELDEENLKKIAKDKDAAEICPAPEAENAYCGKYYYAADEQALNEMYELIAIEIARAMGSVDIIFPVSQGMELSNYDLGTCGIWDDSLNGGLGGFDPNTTSQCRGECSSGFDTCTGGEELKYRDKGISEGFGGIRWWAAMFEARMPCNAPNCDNGSVLFPHKDAAILEISQGIETSWDGIENETVICGSPQYPEEHAKCHKVVPFKYSDLNVLFKEGEVAEDDQSVKASFEVDNNGYFNIALPQGNGLEVSFYRNDLDTRLSAGAGGEFEAILGFEGTETEVTGNASFIDGMLYISIPNPPGGICSWKEGKCVAPNFGENQWKLRVNGIMLGDCGTDCTGTIIALINGNSQVNECPLYNTGEMYCTAVSDLRFFTVDYYVWR